ncbi:unnamed protein product [Victoria cruziana]
MAPPDDLSDGRFGAASAVLAFVFPLLIAYFLLLRRWKHKSSAQRLPPGPWNSQLSAICTNWKHGSLMFLKLGRLPTYVVSSAEVAREILKTHDAVFASRPQLAAFGVFGFGSSDVTFQPYTEAWRQSRRISVGHMSGPKRARSFRSVREEEVGLLVDVISRTTGPVNLSYLVHFLNNNIICKHALGKKFNDKEYGKKGRFYDTFKTARELLGGFGLGDLFPSIKWVDSLSGLQLRLTKSFHELNTFLDEVIRQSQEKDFVRTRLEAQKEKGQQIPLTTNYKTFFLSLNLNVVLGGSDASSAPVVWAMAELMRKPRMMKQSQDELRLNIKGKAKVDESDLDQLEFLKLVVKETLRMHPSLPMLVPRISMGECAIGGYSIPDKAVIIVNAWAIGRDPTSWENPEEFQPERFINCPIDYKGHDFEFIPFSSVIELSLANLLYCFNWSLPGDLSANDIDMGESPGIIVHKKCELVLAAHPYTLRPTE